MWRIEVGGGGIGGRAVLRGNASLGLPRVLLPTPARQTEPPEVEGWPGCGQQGAPSSGTNQLNQ